MQVAGSLGRGALPDLDSCTLGQAEQLRERHFHDLLNDIGKEVVMKDIIGWINARLPAA